MLDALLQNRLSAAAASPSAPLVLLSDTLLQSALALLRALVLAALLPSPAPGAGTAARVVLVCVEQQPHRILPPAGAYDSHRVRVVDAALAGPYASTSKGSASCAGYATVDLSTVADGAAELVQAVRDAVEGEDGPVLVVLDSVNTLADELPGQVGAVARVVKGCLDALRGRKGSRLIVVHHDDFPPRPSHMHTSPTHASLLGTLLLPSLSPATLHLSLRPAAHLALLAREYALPLPTLSTTQAAAEADPRAAHLLALLAARAACDPFVRPLHAEEADERAPLGEGRCVVEWSARGVAVRVADGGGCGIGRGRGEERERAQRGEVKRVVRWGLCGARIGLLEGCGACEVPLSEVVDPAQLGVRNGEQPSPLSSPLPAAPSVAPAAPSTAPAPPSGPDAPLPFSLTLTPSQLSARASVPNPFARADLPIYGEAGYVPPLLPGGGGGIEYTPDRADDWDEEDPDGDLEL